MKMLQRFTASAALALNGNRMLSQVALGRKHRNRSITYARTSTVSEPLAGRARHDRTTDAE